MEIRRRRNAARRLSSGLEQKVSEQPTNARGVQRGRSTNKKRDRFGKEIKVGDRVEFLTPGRLVGKIWKVYKIM